MPHINRLAAASAALCVLAAAFTGTVFGSGAGASLAGGLVPAATRFTEARSIPWHTRLDDAREAALATNRPMLLEFWAGWCAPCKVMDAEVYSDAGVAAAMKKVVAVRIDMDAQGLLARKYNVEGIPTLLFTDSHGNELFRYTGVLNVTQMVALLQDLPGDVARINRLSAGVAADKNNFSALEGLGRELHEAALYKASNQYYQRALRTPGARQAGERRGAVLLGVGRNHLQLQEFREAAGVFERYLREFAGGSLEPEAMLGLGNALLGQKKEASGRRILQTLVTRHPASAPASEAARLLAATQGGW